MKIWDIMLMYFNKEDVKMSLFLDIVGAIFVLIGIVLVYDARPITKKFFSFGDQNEGALGLKMIGFIFTVIGGVLLLFYL